MIRTRRLLPAALLSAWAGLMTACGGGCPSREEAQQELGRANASWDAGDRAGAVQGYKTYYGNRWATAEQKATILPRIVESEVKAGDVGEARAWINRGLDDKIAPEYADPAVRALVADVQRDREADARRRAEQSRAEEQRKREEQEVRDRLVGRWTCTSEVSGGEPVKPGYHNNWAFTGDRLTITGDRRLWYSADWGATPMRLEVYNRVGGQKVVVYSCVFKFDRDKLVVCFNPGDDPPTGFRADRSNTAFLLTFTK